MNPDKDLVRCRFDRGARQYHQLTPVQQALAADLLGGLPTDLQPRRILEIGCGTGHLTALLRARFPEANLRATDVSSGMLAVAAERLAAAGQIRFEAADAEDLATQLEEPYPDMIVGSAVLQWLTDPQATVRSLVRRTAPGGVLAFATFGPRSLSELQELLAALGVAHPLASQPSAAAWRAALSGFDCEVRSDRLTQWAPGAGRFLKELSAMGAGLSHAGLAFADLRQLLSDYDALATDRGVPVTWERIFITVKPEPA